MSFSIPNLLVMFVSFLYTVAAIGYYVTGSWQKGLMFTGYTLANIGVLFLR